MEVESTGFKVIVCTNQPRQTIIAISTGILQICLSSFQNHFLLDFPDTKTRKHGALFSAL